MNNCKLNDKIFDSNNHMLPEVRETFLQIRDDIIADLSEEHDFELKYITFIMSGSLTGINYDQFSDIDLHFLIDYDDYPAEQVDLIKDYLSMYKDAFNRNEYETLGYSIELYFQDIQEPHRSPGIYNIEDDEWLKEPDCTAMRITPEIVDAVRKFSNEIEEFVQRYHSRDYPDLQAFMDELKEYSQKLKDYRSKGMATPEGQYSLENIVFKQLRRGGDLMKLTNLKNDIKRKLYSV